MLPCLQEVAHILAAASPRSLVLIDELGRSTSTSDGAGIAWAVAEALLERSSPTLFATHFGQLSELAAVYPAAKVCVSQRMCSPPLWERSQPSALPLCVTTCPALFFPTHATHESMPAHLSSPPSPPLKALSFDLGDVAGRRALDFTWRLRPGANDAGHYGLLLAAAVGFPADVLATAEEVVQGERYTEGWFETRLLRCATYTWPAATCCNECDHRHLVTPRERSCNA